MSLRLLAALAPLLAVAPARAVEPLLLVTAPAVLQAAERSGAGFARWVGVLPSASGGLATNQALVRAAAWRSITEPIGMSLVTIQRRDKQAGVGIARYSHRLFDARWLASPDAYFELVGVANRMDRRPFQGGACGETRLVYRLAYRTAATQSRLPMTVAVELRGDPPDAGSCISMAKRWQPPPAASKGQALGRWLVSADGPLASQRLSHGRIAQLTTNLQSVRWPSAVRPDLGGHAEYMLRAFRWNAGKPSSVRAASRRASRSRPTPGWTARNGSRIPHAKAPHRCARPRRSASRAACALAPAIRRTATAPAAASRS